MYEMNEKHSQNAINLSLFRIVRDEIDISITLSSNGA